MIGNRIVCPNCRSSNSRSLGSNQPLLFECLGCCQRYYASGKTYACPLCRQLSPVMSYNNGSLFCTSCKQVYTTNGPKLITLDPPKARNKDIEGRIARNLRNRRPPVTPISERILNCPYCGGIMLHLSRDALGWCRSCKARVPGIVVGTNPFLVEEEL